MKCVFAITAFLLCGSPAFAQITLEHDAYEQFLETGFESYTAVDVEGARFELGTLGATDNVYDFTRFEFEAKPSRIRYLSPEETPYFNKYTSATHVIEYESGSYQYFKFATDGFYRLSEHFIFEEEDSYVKNLPAFPMLKFPLTFETSWEYAGQPMAISTKYGLFAKERCVSKVVAAGTLITPAGSEQCLVLKDSSVSELITSMYTNTNRRIVYRFLDSKGFMAMIVIDTSDARSPTPRITYASYMKAASTGIAGTKHIADGIQLHPMYPQPAVSGRAVATWSASQQSTITIALYDVRGVKVATVYEGQTEPGSHTAPVQMQGLPQGMYFLRMTTPDGVQTTKVMKLE